MNIQASKPNAVRALHLYYDLMNLYGDWANVAILAREMARRGIETTVSYLSVGDAVDFNEYDFVFIGSGTERSQRACMKDLAARSDALMARIEDGMHILATGNSHELFGQAVTTSDGERYKTLALLEFETVQKEARVTGDCVCKASFLQERLIGFVNRAGHGQEGNLERPFQTELGPGSRDSSRTEGIKYKNLLGTYLTGPVLVRNPPLLDHIANSLRPGTQTNRAESDPLFAYQSAAYDQALRELSARIEKKRLS